MVEIERDVHERHRVGAEVAQNAVVLCFEGAGDRRDVSVVEGRIADEKMRRSVALPTFRWCGPGLILAARGDCGENCDDSKLHGNRRATRSSCPTPCVTSNGCRSDRSSRVETK